jgi:hypothetical protein
MVVYGQINITGSIRLTLISAANIAANWAIFHPSGYIYSEPQWYSNIARATDKWLIEELENFLRPQDSATKLPL